MAGVVWPESVLQLLLDLPERDRARVLRKADALQHFPRMYPVRASGPFRNHRWFVAGDWIVYYRVVRETVYIRGIWPARIPLD
jgi:plasmid stabilization system protein ParE